MNIVILDGQLTNPGDLSWSCLEEFGKLTVYDYTEEHQVIERSKDADILVFGRTGFNKEYFRACKKLKLIATLSVGVNNIDLNAADKAGVYVCNSPTYCANAVAQSAFSLLLGLCNNVQRLSMEISQNGWDSAVDLNYNSLPLIELSGKTIGILGYGNIGKKTAQIARGFGMNVLISSRIKKSCEYEWVDRETLFKESDVVSIHCPLTDETRGLVNKDLLSLMKPTAFIINTSRGAIINERDLASALLEGRLAGAGLDVMFPEPPLSDNPLIKLDNCIITPHIGWSSMESRINLIKEVRDNIKSFLDGNPRNLVNNPTI